MSVSRFKFSVKPQEAILIVITMFWGGTFLAVQYAVTLSGPFFFVGVRFATAALAVALLSLHTLHKLTWLEVKAGVAIGIAIALGYSLQTWGLQFIPSSKSAFITAMYVPLVPLLQWLCLGRMPGLMPCVGIVLAFIGLIFLAGPGGNLLALGEGEWITLAGAVAIAAEIILISAWAGKVDVRRVTVVQLATASIVAFIAMGPAGETVPPMSTGLLVVALGSTAQIGLWVAASLAMVVLWFKVFKRGEYLQSRTRAGQSDGDSIGEIGLMSKAAEPFARGRVRFQKPLLGAEEWECMVDEPIAAGERVRVVAVEGSFLKVVKV